MNVTGVTIEGGTPGTVRRELAEPTGTEVLVEIGAAGVCGSDLKALTPGASTLTRTAGVFGGHEGAGVVLAVGDQVRALVPGDQVLVYSYQGCQDCPQCARGEPKFCPTATATSVGRDGTWATHMLVAGASCLRLPDGFGLADAAVLACTGGTAATAVAKVGELPPGTPVVVFGVGPLGCAVAQLLTGTGAVVQAVEPNAGRLAYAVERGWIVGAAGQDPHDFPVVFETSGSQPGRINAVRAAGQGATVVHVGLGAATVELAVDQVIRRELRLVGSHFWTLGGFPDIVGLYRRAGARPADLVTGEYPLDDIALACRDAVTAFGKLLLRPSARGD